MKYHSQPQHADCCLQRLFLCETTPSPESQPHSPVSPQSYHAVLHCLQIFDYVDSSPVLRRNTYIMLTSDNGEGICGSYIPQMLALQIGASAYSCAQPPAGAQHLHHESAITGRGLAATASAYSGNGSGIVIT